MKELWKKRKNATPKVSCVLVHFALKRKYKLALTSDQLCVCMYFKWDETLIPNASFVDHSEKLWKKRDVLP